MVDCHLYNIIVLVEINLFEDTPEDSILALHIIPQYQLRLHTYETSVLLSPNIIHLHCMCFTKNLINQSITSVSLTNGLDESVKYIFN